MGGTSFDVSLIRDGQPELRNSMMINTYTVRTPNIDIISIGAGGGSIAWIDEGGGVRIGPESAGAEPGPVCYKRGGTRPTVTDCNLILGYVDPESFLGGDFSLDVAAARAAISEHLAVPLGVSIEEAATTVRQVANALMAQAMRLATVERGYDPRDFIFIPYGGAGPVHAVDLARALEIPTVVLPPMPGLFSAFGMLVADAVQDLQASVVSTADDTDPAHVEALFAGLEKEARQRLRAANVRDEDIRVETSFRLPISRAGRDHPDRVSGRAHYPPKHRPSGGDVCDGASTALEFRRRQSSGADRQSAAADHRQDRRFLGRRDPPAQRRGLKAGRTRADLRWREMDRDAALSP